MRYAVGSPWQWRLSCNINILDFLLGVIWIVRISKVGIGCSGLWQPSAMGHFGDSVLRFWCCMWWFKSLIEKFSLFLPAWWLWECVLVFRFLLFVLLASINICTFWRQNFALLEPHASFVLKFWFLVFFDLIAYIESVAYMVDGLDEGCYI